MPRNHAVLKRIIHLVASLRRKETDASIFKSCLNQDQFKWIVIEGVKVVTLSVFFITDGVLVHSRQAGRPGEKHVSFKYIKV